MQYIFIYSSVAPEMKILGHSRFDKSGAALMLARIPKRRTYLNEIFIRLLGKTSKITHHFKI